MTHASNVNEAIKTNVDLYFYRDNLELVNLIYTKSGRISDAAVILLLVQQDYSDITSPNAIKLLRAIILEMTVIDFYDLTTRKFLLQSTRKRREQTRKLMKQFENTYKKEFDDYFHHCLLKHQKSYAIYIDTLTQLLRC